MVVQTTAEPMPPLEGDKYHIASVSGYGFGGANCHAVFQSPPRRVNTTISPSLPTPSPAAMPYLFAVGGSSKDAVARLTESWSNMEVINHTQKRFTHDFLNTKLLSPSCDYREVDSTLLPSVVSSAVESVVTNGVVSQ